MFTKNRDRLMTTDMSRKVMSAILAHREIAPLLSDEHFSVDGTLIKAWASMKSVQPQVEGTQHDNEGSDDPPAHDPSPDAQLNHPKSETEPMPTPAVAPATPKSTSEATSVQTPPMPRPPTRRHGFTRSPLARVLCYASWDMR